MKTLKSKLWLLIVFFIPFISKAQYTQILAGPNISPAINYIYVGSLNLDINNAANCQKMKVSVIGNGWGSDNIGETIFYIANRGGLAVNQVVTGGNGLSGTTLRAFLNGNNTDFYLQISYSTAYYSMAVNSFLMGGLNSSGRNVNITTSVNTPAGTDITASVSFNPVMITDASGNIGIGAPNTNGYKFAVKGNLHAQRVNVDLTNWADYVLTPTYTLPTLSEVKTYIDKNHHLPEIPSEQEVVKNGINLGEMNKLLVKKVEELTLYLIENDKNIDILTKQLKKQQDQITELKKLIIK